MASLATLRANTLVYLGTTSADKAYPPATLNFCINNAVNSLLNDIGEANPGWLSNTTTWAAQASRDYGLPSNFSGWLEVRLNDADGVLLTEVRSDELDSVTGYVFALTGSDHAGILTTGGTVDAGTALYLKYKAWPVDLVADYDEPEMVPRKFHDLVVLTAAEEAMGLGGEGALPVTLVNRKVDRHAQLIAHVARRGVAIMGIRGGGETQWDDE